jgi:uncharacterized protein YneF (UPF0154 family)
VCAITAILLLFSVAGGFVICGKTDEKDMMNNENE